MRRHGSTLASGEGLHADVCIVGGGPAGLTVASALRGSGLHVLLLEAGDDPAPAGGEEYGSSRSVGLRYPLAQSRARGVGGSAHRWDIETPAGGPRVRLRELDELDFEDRPGVRSPGWPFSRSHLEPHYRRARELFGLQPAEREEDVPLAQGGAQRLFSFGPASVFTATLPEELGSPSSTTVLSGSVATELHTEGPGRPVTSLSGRTRTGTSFSVTARAFVLASGGIENPRLLLASRTTTPCGVGNDFQQVGRYFMEHPHYLSGVLLPAGHSLQQRREAWDVVLVDGHPVQRKYGLSGRRQRSEGLLNTAYFVTPRRAAMPVPVTAAGRSRPGGLAAVEHVRRMVFSRTLGPGAARDVADVLAAAPATADYVVRQLRGERADRRGVPRRTPLTFTLGAMAEQQPRGDSVVRLGDRLDAFGVPEAELDWRAGSAEADTMWRTQELIAPSLAHVLGASVVPLLPAQGLPRMNGGYHHMGTTRMSLRPQDGVVDADGRVHGVGNLFVAGSSVFPTGGSANPTLTIVALAFRLADLLRKETRPPA